jgi:hypothetical protein
MQKPTVLFAALIAALAVLAATPSVAAAGTPCWKKVDQDYSADGQITGHYSRTCLRQALKNTPEDLRDYSPILDEISALLDGSGGNQGGNGDGSNPSGTGANATMHPAETAAEKAQAAKERTRKANQAVPAAGTKESIPDTSRSIPLPLLLLAAIGLAAALAAASPPLIRRFRGRFPRFGPAAGSVRPPS